MRNSIRVSPLDKNEKSKMQQQQKNCASVRLTSTFLSSETKATNFHTQVPSSSDSDASHEGMDHPDRPFQELSGGLPPESTKDSKNMLFFRDGKRRIDLVLVNQDDNLEIGVLNEIETFKIADRNKFEQNLLKEGLELEIETKEASYDHRTRFVKLHVPYHLITKYAKIMHMKKHLKRFISISVDAWEGIEESTAEQDVFCSPVQDIFRLNSSYVHDDPNLYTSFFGHDYEDQLLVKSREKYYTSAQRSQIAWHILLKTKFGDDNNKIGIRKLLNSGAYLSVFPLHEGRYNKDSEYGVMYDRRLLYLEWAHPSRWYKFQPLWLVRKYFGDKIALYFAWLGFYTQMLILPSIVGLGCFIYGLVTMDSTENTPSKEICDLSIAGNITLCPLCESGCKYQKLSNSCVFSKLTYLFDNPSTVFFSVFMSFWATSFLEMWKRKQAVLAWQWDLHLYIEEEDTRPEYDTSGNLFKINPVTRRKEPFIPTWEKVKPICISGAVVFAMIVIVLSTVMATINFRLVLLTFCYNTDRPYLKSHAKLITSILAALINLNFIIILTKIYHYIAIWLTNCENPKTDTDYEKSFILKIFIFEFMNYYSSQIYIAFFKGRIFTYPADTQSDNSLWSRIRGDVCDPAGCLSELCIQLAIIMVGKQCFNNVLELGFPAMRNWWRHKLHEIAKKDPNKEYTHWEENYNLQDPGKLALFEEYLEMVIQYGFVTLFVAAFPLAPLFALLNNICEIRLDAFKMIAQARRPLAERVDNIGAWFQVLRGITYMAVVFNAFVIAYTSDYIPRKIYQYFYSENYTLVGYIDSSLSVFNTSHYPESDKYDRRSSGMTTEPETCQYRGYRNGPENYELSLQYWHIFAARLIFVIVFEHFVFFLTGLIANIIPDVPHQIHRQIQLEKLLAKDASDVSDQQTDSSENQDDDYGELISAIRGSRYSAKLTDIMERRRFVRKISRHSVISIRKPSKDDEIG